MRSNKIFTERCVTMRFNSSTSRMSNGLRRPKRWLWREKRDALELMLRGRSAKKFKREWLRSVNKDKRKRS